MARFFFAVALEDLMSRALQLHIDISCVAFVGPKLASSNALFIFSTAPEPFCRVKLRVFG